MQHLHENIQLVLALTPHTVSLQDHSLLADKVCEVPLPPLPVAALSNRIPSPTTHEHSLQIANLQGQITQLTVQLQALSTQLHTRDQPHLCARSHSGSCPFQPQS